MSGWNLNVSQSYVSSGSCSVYSSLVIDCSLVVVLYQALCSLILHIHSLVFIQNSRRSLSRFLEFFLSIAPFSPVFSLQYSMCIFQPPHPPQTWSSVSSTQQEYFVLLRNLPPGFMYWYMSSDKKQKQLLGLSYFYLFF